MTLLEEVRTNLRIHTTALDDDIRADIDAALIQLGISGVENRVENDPLVAKAVKLYCRWQNDFLGKGEQYGAAFEALKIAMALSSDYNEDGIGDICTMMK